MSSQPEGLRQIPLPLRRLASRIRGQIDTLLDAHEIAALVEAMGITDREVREEYGERDVYSLACRLELVLMRGDIPALAMDDDISDPEPYGYENLFTAALDRIQQMRAYTWGLEVGRLHIKGFLFAMPMVVSIIGLFMLRESLWAAIINDIPTATAIGLGTIGSFIGTGGYAQAIGRRGLFYRTQDEHTLSRTVCYYFIGVGVQTTFIAGLLAFCLNFVFSVLTLKLALVALAYYWFLSLLWLFLAVLYMLGQPLVFTPIIVVGIIVVHVLQHFGPSVVLRQSLALLLAGGISFAGGYAAFGRSGRRRTLLTLGSIAAAVVMFYAVRELSGLEQNLVTGICTASLLSLCVILYTFSRREMSRDEKVQNTTLPRSSLLWYKVGSYFVYGLVYYAFLFMDRIMAWSTPDTHLLLSRIRFKTAYEVGMDWGLIVLLCTIGLAESAINSFSERIRDDENYCPLEEYKRLGKTYREFYYVRAASFCVMGILAGFVLWFGVTAIARNSSDPAVRAYLDPLTEWVFLMCTPAYGFLSWALFNNVLMFALSRPERVIYSMWAAVLINTAISYVLSRSLGHQFAAIGFLAGCVVLAVATTRNALQVIDRLDYFYYSAYL